MRTTDPEGYLNGQNAVYLDTLENENFSVPVFKKRNGGKNLKDSETSEGLRPRARRLLDAYRRFGHTEANLDPLSMNKIDPHPSLYPSFYSINPSDMEKRVSLPIKGVETEATLKEQIKNMRDIYCDNIGFEVAYIDNFDERTWLEERIEEKNQKKVSELSSERKNILNQLIQAEAFEKFIHVKFPGAKRFSLEGSDSLMPALNFMAQQAIDMDITDIVIGMAHRGRLNVLTNFLGKSYSSIFAHFINDEKVTLDIGSGDVKYHSGYSNVYEKNQKSLNLSLTPNPSHLEAVNPVTIGKVRAKTERSEKSNALALIIHGDAAFAGQGIVSETICLSGLEGYKTGGSIHVIINNQVGFTTSPEFSRSSRYSSDLAKMVQMPIFHVNGDDPESVVWCMKVAMEYRNKFKKDVMIDLISYRRYGHNEGDEPMFTQPLMYKKIKQHPTPLKIYSDKLIENKTITTDEFSSMKEKFDDILKESFKNATNFEKGFLEKDWFKQSWGHLLYKDEKELLDEKVKTNVEKDKIISIGKSIFKEPEGIKVNAKVERLFKDRLDFFIKNDVDEKFIDWGMAELLSFGSLLLEKHDIRISGQDCGRGTFSHRHAVIVDQENQKKYIPLNNIKKEQSKFTIVDSPLSEAAVLGFEYGYAQASPNTLVLWEAQFGDFSNGAQIIIDQFISSGESKWLRLNGLVMLLPHGYEGMGPEHSSCRIERYLQLCGKGNMIVANCTTPANYFHILRRQMKSKTRKPLIIATPKSLLRHKKAVSSINDLSNIEEFQKVIETKSKKHTDRLILCSGKIYYELMDKIESEKIENISILRIEQLYPYPEEDIKNILNKYKDSEIVWCQEEPENMGAWTYIRNKLDDTLDSIGNNKSKILYAGIEEKASPSTGYASQHVKNQAFIIEKAINYSLKNKGKK